MRKLIAKLGLFAFISGCAFMPLTGCVVHADDDDDFEDAVEDTADEVEDFFD